MMLNSPIFICNLFRPVSREQLEYLLSDFAKRWLAHDGLWFQAAESAYALNYRLYSLLNEQEIIEQSDTSFIFLMKNCRVQEARKRKQLPDFPCRSVGLVEYSGFAATIDPRIVTTCVACPPDPHPPDYYCAWEFKITT